MSAIIRTMLQTLCATAKIILEYDSGNDARFIQLKVDLGRAVLNARDILRDKE